MAKDLRVLIADLHNFARYPTVAVGYLAGVLRSAGIDVEVFSPFSHGVTGVTPVAKVQNSGKKKTYNLVVADFHTFYTGFGKALCHDNTFRRPVNEIVPGLRYP